MRCEQSERKAAHVVLFLRIPDLFFYQELASISRSSCSMTNRTRDSDMWVFKLSITKRYPASGTRATNSCKCCTKSTSCHRRYQTTRLEISKHYDNSTPNKKGSTFKK